MAIIHTIAKCSGDSKLAQRHHPATGATTLEMPKHVLVSACPVCTCSVRS